MDAAPLQRTENRASNGGVQFHNASHLRDRRDGGNAFDRRLKAIKIATTSSR